MALSKEVKIERLKKSASIIKGRMLDIKNPTFYNRVDREILDVLIDWIDWFQDPYSKDIGDKILPEYFEYFNKSLDAFNRDLDSGVYGEEDFP